MQQHCSRILSSPVCTAVQPIEDIVDDAKAHASEAEWSDDEMLPDSAFYRS